jgi:DNA-binding transcriptional regulator LsrR (DeoR family)
MQPQPPRRSAAPATARRPWTARQEKLARIYNEQGLRPAEIAQKLGVSTYTATQIILAARNRAEG